MAPRVERAAMRRLDIHSRQAIDEAMLETHSQPNTVRGDNQRTGGQADQSLPDQAPGSASTGPPGNLLPIRFGFSMSITIISSGPIQQPSPFGTPAVFKNCRRAIFRRIQMSRKRVWRTTPTGFRTVNPSNHTGPSTRRVKPKKRFAGPAGFPYPVGEQD